MAKNKPEKSFKAGAVDVAVFKNSGEYGVYRTCSVSVRYKSGDEWKYGQSMKASDAIIAAALLEDARKYMMESDARDNATRESRHNPGKVVHKGERVTSKTPDPEEEEAPF